MKYFLFLLIKIMIFETEATESDINNSYKKVDEVSMVAEWIDSQLTKKEFNGLERQIDRTSNRIFMLRRTKMNDASVFEADYRAYVVARTDKVISFISVEREKKLQFYYGAKAQDDGYSFNERVTYLYPNEKISDPEFYKVYTALSEISERLYDLYGDYPLSQSQMVNEKEFSKYGGYSLVRVQLNDNMPLSMLEEFLLMLWSSLETNTSLPDLSIPTDRSCSGFLINPSSY